MLYSCASDETRAVILRQREGLSEWASRGFSCNENCCWYETEDGLTKVNLGGLRAVDHEAAEGRSAHAPGDARGDLARNHIIKLAFERLIDRTSFSEWLIHT